MLNATPWRSRTRARAAAFRRDASAVSAIEFALILPLALTLWAGMAEMSHAIDNWRKVTLLARTVSDLTSEGDTSDPISSATMSDILGASGTVLRPFPAANAKIVVSALAVNTLASLVNPVVCSSTATSNAVARKTGVATDLTIPAGFNISGNRYVLAEVSMNYTPMLGSSLVNLVGGINGSIALKSSFPWPVRNGLTHNSITGTPEVAMPGGAWCP